MQNFFIFYFLKIPVEISPCFYAYALHYAKHEFQRTIIIKIMIIVVRLIAIENGEKGCVIKEGRKFMSGWIELLPTSPSLFALPFSLLSAAFPLLVKRHPLSSPICPSLARYQEKFSILPLSTFSLTNYYSTTKPKKNNTLICLFLPTNLHKVINQIIYNNNSYK